MTSSTSYLRGNALHEELIGSFKKRLESSVAAPAIDEAKLHEVMKDDMKFRSRMMGEVIDKLSMSTREAAEKVDWSKFAVRIDELKNTARERPTTKAKKAPAPTQEIKPLTESPFGEW